MRTRGREDGWSGPSGLQQGAPQPAAPSPPSPAEGDSQGVTQTRVTHSGCRRAAGAGAGGRGAGPGGTRGARGAPASSRVRESSQPRAGLRGPSGRPWCREPRRAAGRGGSRGPRSTGGDALLAHYLVHADGPLCPLQRHGVGRLQPLGHGFLEPLVEAAEGQRPGPGDEGAGSGPRRGPGALLALSRKKLPRGGGSGSATLGRPPPCLGAEVSINPTQGQACDPPGDATHHSDTSRQQPGPSRAALVTGWVPAWEEVPHPAELLQVHVELEEALGRGLGHAAAHLTQLLLDVLCDLAASKARVGSR